jgi:hypothetical protein
MEEDFYKQFLDKAKKDKPQLRDVQSFKSKTMREISPTKKGGDLLQFFRVAASIIMLFTMGAYIWMEVYTWESRLAIEQGVVTEPMQHQSNWQCRHSVNELLASLFNTSALVRHNDGVYINKKNMQLLEVENAELFSIMEAVIGHIKQHSPSDFQAYQSGEDMRLNAWLLRHEYSICELLTK